MNVARLSDINAACDMNVSRPPDTSRFATTAIQRGHAAFMRFWHPQWWRAVPQMGLDHLDGLTPAVRPWIGVHIERIKPLYASMLSPWTIQPGARSASPMTCCSPYSARPAEADRRIRLATCQRRTKSAINRAKWFSAGQSWSEGGINRLWSMSSSTKHFVMPSSATTMSQFWSFSVMPVAKSISDRLLLDLARSCRNTFSVLVGKKPGSPACAQTYVYINSATKPWAWQRRLTDPS